LLAPLLAVVVAAVILIGGPWLVWRLWRGVKRHGMATGST
jgi:hypothetical protein